MVELSLVEEVNDMKELLELLKRHVVFTRSKKAEMIMDNPDRYIPMFIKVVPYDYKKVLQEQKLEELNRKIADVEMDVEFGTRY